MDDTTFYRLVAEYQICETTAQDCVQRLEEINKLTKALPSLEVSSSLEEMKLKEEERTELERTSHESRQQLTEMMQEAYRRQREIGTILSSHLPSHRWIRFGDQAVSVHYTFESTRSPRGGYDLIFRPWSEVEREHMPPHTPQRRNNLPTMVIGVLASFTIFEIGAISTPSYVILGGIIMGWGALLFLFFATWIILKLAVALSKSR